MKALKKIFGIPKKKFTFFVVEDSDIFRDLLSHFISDIDSKKSLKEKVDFEIHSFSTGEECLKALEKKPDIVVLDYQLDRYPNTENPRSKRVKLMNGLDTLKVIKKISPSTETIMVTAKGDFKLNTEAVDIGAAEYIEKGPGIREKLQTAIAKLLTKISGSEEQSFALP